MPFHWAKLCQNSNLTIKKQNTCKNIRNVKPEMGSDMIAA